MKPLNSLALAALVAFGPVSGAAAAEPEVRRLGKTLVQHKDEVAKVVVSTKFANTQLDKAWIFFDARFSAEGGEPVRVGREDISLVVPGGTRLNMPSQRALADEVKDMRFLMKKADISREPLDDYFPGRERFEQISFFVVPGERIVFDEFTVSRETLAGGVLFFKTPMGTWEPGRYSLEIRNKWINASLPFDLPASPFDKDSKKKDPKSVPW